MENRNWIITAVISSIVLIFSVLIGLSVHNMTIEKTDPSKETDVQESEIDSPSENESKSEPDSTSESPSEPETAPSTETESPVSFRMPEEADYERIRAQYDQTIKSYYATAALNTNGDPVDVVRFESIFDPMFEGKVHCRNRSGKISLSFILVREYDSNTEYVLNYLREKEVKSIFFTDYYYAEAHPDIIRRILADGHQIGSLGYSLPTNGFASLTLEKQADEINKFHIYMRDHFGIRMDRFTFVNSQYSDASIALIIEMGYEVEFYTVNYADFEHNKIIQASAFLEAMKGRFHAGADYLLHTVNTASLVVIPALIDSIREQGYTISIAE